MGRAAREREREERSDKNTAKSSISILLRANKPLSTLFTTTPPRRYSYWNGEENESCNLEPDNPTPLSLTLHLLLASLLSKGKGGGKGRGGNNDAFFTDKNLLPGTMSLLGRHRSRRMIFIILRLREEKREGGGGGERYAGHDDNEE